MLHFEYKINKQLCMGKWKPKTFQHDNMKDIHCRNCGRYLNYSSRLMDNKMVQRKCKDCNTMNPIFPPRKAVVDGNPVILFGDSAPNRDPMECTFTADLSAK